MRPLHRALALAAACIALAIGCGSRSERPNVVLISIDTLRVDRLGFAGHDRPTSPHLDALTREGVVFERAYSRAGWTLPAMASILTGVNPREHGARRFLAPIGRDLRTLAEILAAHGYDTRGYVAQMFLLPSYGFDRGFRRYDATSIDVGNPHEVTTAEALTDRALAELDGRPPREPLFLWLHYLDPHSDYLQHPEWRFGGAPEDRYDSEIAYTDHHVGRLLAGLRERGIYENAVVVMTSDHGEEFGERRGTLHATLHEEVVRVPLVVRAPGLAPGRRDTFARHIDVAPTILARLGLPAPPEWPGRDLLGDEPSAERPVFFSREVPTNFRQHGVRLGDHKLLVVERRDVPAHDPGFQRHPGLVPGVFLYDLARDPGETHDLYREGDPLAQRMLALVREHFEEPTLGATDPP